MQLSIVVVPVYKPLEKCCNNELLSLKQAINIFKKRDIFLLAPDSISLEGYKTFFHEHKKRFQSLILQSEYFKNIGGYNRLCISADLYKHFGQYQFMLLYQLDAWVFRDELDEWCSKNYDYIGAPWFVGYGEPKQPFQFLGAGNGGFSLRKVSSFYKISSNALFMQWYYFKRKIYKAYQKRSYLTRLPVLWRLMRPLAHICDQEDFFWAQEVPRYFKRFKVAPPQVALKFSFEAAPRQLYKMNNYQLPFGCHAWEKYEPDFWKEFIPVQQNASI